MSYSTMLSLLVATMVGLASSTCSVSSSDEKAEAKDTANYQVTKLYINTDKELSPPSQPALPPLKLKLGSSLRLLFSTSSWLHILTR